VSRTRWSLSSVGRSLLTDAAGYILTGQNVLAAGSRVDC
jgi:hypothetical protein